MEKYRCLINAAEAKLFWNIRLITIKLEPISKLKYYELSCPHVISGHPEHIEYTGFLPFRPGGSAEADAGMTRKGSLEMKSNFEIGSNMFPALMRKENTMAKYVVIILVSFIIAIPSYLIAADFDGSVPLLCAVIKATDCGFEDGCIEGTAESINLPQFIKIDFEKNRVSTVKEGETQRESEIRNMQNVDGKIIMQGIERGRGWSVVIGNTGKMSAAVSEERVSFVVFGACTPL